MKSMKFALVLIFFVVSLTIIFSDRESEAGSSLKILLDGQPLQLNDQPLLHPVTHKVYIPLRSVQEQFGNQVHWDEKSRTIHMYRHEYETLATRTVDAWGRSIREMKLPKNAGDYPYILKKYENKMYEMKYPYNLPDKARTARKLFASGVPFTKSNLDATCKRIKEYYRLILNVDYRTLKHPDEWARKVFDLRSQGVNARVAMQEVRKYAQWVVQNKIILEGELNPEPSMIFDNGYEYFIRSAFRLKINSFSENRDIIYDIAYNWNKLDKNKWYEGYADLAVDTNGEGDWGAKSRVSNDASLFLNSLIQGVNDGEED